jgi:hypothetical protein
MRKLTAITLYCLLGASAFAQDLTQNFKNWYLGSVNLKLSKTNSISLGHLSSFDADGYDYGFMQNRLNFNHKFGKSWTGTIGYAHSIIGVGDDDPTTFSRVHLAASHRLKHNHLRIQNKVQLEQYFTQLPKYRSRAILSTKWQYYDKNLPLRLSPYVKHQVFYYQGGEEIPYELDPEDIEDGEERFIEQSPNGWHRYRFTTGVKARLSPELSLTLFYTLQREFNTGLDPFREINVENPSGGKTLQPFNNYSLLGVSLVYTFKLY